MTVKNGKYRRAAPGRPLFDKHVVENLIVYGEECEDPFTKIKTRKFPSYKKIAEMFDVSAAAIGAFSLKHKLMERRKKYLYGSDQLVLLNEVNKKEEQETEKELQKAFEDPARLSLDELIGTIDGWVQRFRHNIANDEVRADSANDLATLLRVRELLLGRATQRTDHTGHVTLEAIQSTHTDWRARAIDAGTPFTEGIAGHGESEAKALPAAFETASLSRASDMESETLLSTLERAVAKKQ